MGEGTYVNNPVPLRQSRTGSSDSGDRASQTRPAAAQRPLRLRFDVPLLLIVITLVVFGLLMVLSASVDASLLMGNSPTYLFVRQLRWVAAGTVVAVFLAWFDYHKMRPWLLILVFVTLAALVAVLIIRDERFNATRSIFGGSIQPSEMAKLVTVVYLSFWLYARGEDINNFSLGLFPMAAILGIIGGLILLQPDLSAVFTIIFLGGILFFLAGGAWRQIILILAIAFVSGYIIINIFPTGSSRIADYIQGLNNPIDASYHVRRSLEAVVKGGWFGVGIGNATTKFIGLPVPATDSIYAVVVEETGLLGGTGIVALYLGLLWRGLTIARRATDKLGALLASGLSLWLTLEAMINMTVIVGLVPVSGNALPFISAGGSSMMVCLAAIGIIMNVARTSVKQEETEGRSFSAVVDLRRRNRGGRVSRPNRSANTPEQPTAARRSRSSQSTREYSSSLDFPFGDGNSLDLD